MHPASPSPRPSPYLSSTAGGERVVLDTQVVLDWLVFRDASTVALGHAITTRSMHWLASQPMLQEIEHVLDRGVGASWSPDRAAIRATCDRFALPAPVADASHLRCADPDDQMFIDLALAAGARWLFTRDKALLRLATRARDGGVHVLRPADWRTIPAPQRDPPRR